MKINWCEFFQVMTQARRPAVGLSVAMPYEVVAALDVATTDVLAKAHGMFTLPPGEDRNLSRDARQWIDEFSEDAA